MALMIGATFMKFGRAPTTDMIFIFSGKDTLFLSLATAKRWQWPFFHNCAYSSDDTFQRTASCDLGLVTYFSPFEPDSRPKLFDTLDKNQPSSSRKVSIHTANTSSENTIDWHTQCRSFAIHCAPAADHKIGIPDQIESIHH